MRIRVAGRREEGRRKVRVQHSNIQRRADEVRRKEEERTLRVAVELFEESPCFEVVTDLSNLHGKGVGAVGRLGEVAGGVDEDADDGIAVLSAGDTYWGEE